MARTLAKILDVPFASCDATTYTQAGCRSNALCRNLSNAQMSAKMWSNVYYGFYKLQITM